MADDIAVASAPAAPEAVSPSPAASPPVETAAAPAAPAVPSESAAPPASSPAIAETAPAAKPVEAAASEAPKPAVSLLAEAGKEPPKPEEAKAADAPVAETPVAPAFDAFTVPDGIKLGDKEIGQFTGMLGQLELDTKADHRLVQEFGQKALDMYIAERQRDRQLQAEAWNQVRKEWVDQIKSDPVLGRNRFDTVLRDAARVRDMFATDRFKQMIDYTGAGDHPGMMDFVHNVARFLEKRGLLREGTPVAAPPARTPAGKQGPRARYNRNAGA